MTAFWRNIAPREQLGRPVAPERWTQGHLQQLWCRCDNCKWSGPSTEFVMFEKGWDTATICDHAWCAGDSTFVAQLLADGWQTR